MNRLKWSAIATCALLLAQPACIAATRPLPEHVQLAAVQVLESDSIFLSGADAAGFVRYDAAGNVEAFGCEFMSTLVFHREGGGEKGTVTLGQCEKDSSLNENIGAMQVKNFRTGVTAAEMPAATLKALEANAKSDVVHEQGAISVQYSQLLITGVGNTGGHGAAFIDTVLLAPEGSKKVIVVQGVFRECETLDEGANGKSCKLMELLREVARKVNFALAGPAPKQLSNMRP